jgi:hypothetical protein
MELRLQAEALASSGRGSDGLRARHLDEQAEKLLHLDEAPMLAHGEGLPGEYCDGLAGLYDTLEAPKDQIAVDASVQRQVLAAEAGSLETTLDLNASIGAKNSIEKMLGAQAAALHRAGMKLIAKAEMDGERTPNVELVRLTNGATRCFDSFQGTILTLQQLRGASRVQRIVVQRVEMQNGSQAVIVPELPSRGSK